MYTDYKIARTEQTGNAVNVLVRVYEGDYFEEKRANPDDPKAEPTVVKVYRRTKLLKEYWEQHPVTSEKATITASADKVLAADKERIPITEQTVKAAEPIKEATDAAGLLG